MTRAIVFRERKTKQRIGCEYRQVISCQVVVVDGETLSPDTIYLCKRRREVVDAVWCKLICDHRKWEHGK